MISDFFCDSELQILQTFSGEKNFIEKKLKKFFVIFYIEKSKQIISYKNFLLNYE